MARQIPQGVDADLSDHVARRSWNESALNWASRNARLLAPLVTLICMVIFFSLVTDVFLTVQNLQNVVTQIAPIAVAATGVTFVLLCAEIDLGIASVATLTGVLAAWMWVGEVVSVGNWGIPAFAPDRGADRASQRGARCLRRYTVVHDDSRHADHRSRYVGLRQRRQADLRSPAGAEANWQRQ